MPTMLGLTPSALSRTRRSGAAGLLAGGRAPLGLGRGRRGRDRFRFVGELEPAQPVRLLLGLGQRWRLGSPPTAGSRSRPRRGSQAGPIRDVDRGPARAAARACAGNSRGTGAGRGRPEHGLERDVQVVGPQAVGQVVVPVLLGAVLARLDLAPPNVPVAQLLPGIVLAKAHRVRGLRRVEPAEQVQILRCMGMPASARTRCLDSLSSGTSRVSRSGTSCHTYRVPVAVSTASSHVWRLTDL